MADKARQPHVLSAEFTRILCISAHPDDNEFAIAGSVARWAREGRDVVFCLVTTGGSGTNEHTPDNTGLIPIRERESWDAAKILGVKEVFISGSIPPDTYIDIGDTLALKCAALKAHVSQVGKGEWVDELLRAWALRDGKEAGVKHAEGFKRMALWRGDS